MVPIVSAKGLCLDNGLGRAPVFLGNTDPAIVAFLRVDAYMVQSQLAGVKLNLGQLFANSPLGTLSHANAALQAGIGNLVSHFKIFSI